MNRLLALAALAALLVLAPPATRAETLGTCSGFVTSLPAVIGTQGTWCLSQDLSTAVASGAAISITTNNVTLDCNNFKVGGLAAGVGSVTIGVHAQNRLNVTIRNCNIRGFYQGILLSGTGSGHLVERNRLDGNLFSAIVILGGDGSVIRDNMVTDTGGSSNTNYASVIHTSGNVDILDNLVAGSIPGTCCSADGHGFGIHALDNPAALIARNRVHGITRRENGGTRGIIVSNAEGGLTQVTNNHIVASGPTGSIAVWCSHATVSVSGNYLAGHQAPLNLCRDQGGNLIN